MRYELLPDETVDLDGYTAEKLFLNRQYGVALLRYNDNKVGFLILCEDDFHWFTNGGYSSAYWFFDLQEVLQEAKTWCDENCDPFVPDGHIFGYLWKAK